VVYAAESKQLLSGGEDALIVFWNMDVKRKETPEWAESDKCQKCGSPFFWNVRSMLSLRTVGGRQHHCRRCGRAFCGACTQHSRIIPHMGYEFEVRICDACDAELAAVPDEQQPWALMHDARHRIVAMDLDEQRKLLLTVGTDRIIKIWDVSSILC
jgi:WD40 repeat protein